MPKPGLTERILEQLEDGNIYTAAQLGKVLGVEFTPPVSKTLELLASQSLVNVKENWGPRGGSGYYKLEKMQPNVSERDQLQSWDEVEI